MAGSIKIPQRINGHTEYITVDNSNSNLSSSSTNNKHSADSIIGTFNADDSPAVWKPLLGYNYYDQIGTEGKYKSFAYALINKDSLFTSRASTYLYKQYRIKKNEISDPDHPFIKWIINARNRYGMSWKEMLYFWKANLKLYGTAYGWIQRVSLLGTNIPVEIIPLPSKYVYAHYNGQNTMIEYYNYGGKIKILPEDMIRFKIPSPDNIAQGYAPVSAFNFTLDIDYLQSRYRRRFFDNDALPGFAVSFPDEYSDVTYNRLESRLNEKHAGVDNARKALILEAGANVQQLGSGQSRELDFNQSRDQIFKEMCVILDVPEQAVGIYKDSNYSNSRNALIGWVETSISPFTEMVLNEPLTAFVKDNFDKRLVTSMEYDFVDPEFQLKEIELFAKHKLASKNELRRLRNWDDYPDERADELYSEQAEVEEEPIQNKTQKNEEEL